MFQKLNRKTLSDVLLIAALVVFTLFDFYYLKGIGKVPDYIGLLLAGLGILVHPDRFSFEKYLHALKTYKIVFILLTLNVIYSLFFGTYLTALAMLTGLYAILCFALYIDVNKLKKTVSILTVVHLAFFFFQYFAFKLFHLVVDYLSLSGSLPARIYFENTNFFRAAGLFREPNTYCTFMCILLAIRLMFFERKYFLNILILLTMVLSESVWGIFAALFIGVVCVKNWKFSLGTALFFIFICVSVSNGHNYFRFTHTTINRFMNLSEDPSAYDRYLVGQDSEKEIAMQKLKTQNRGDFVTRAFHLFVGNGINVDLYQVLFGSNGLGFLVYAFGLIGMFLLVSNFFQFVNWSYWNVIMCYFFVISASPLFTIMYWWVGLWIVILGTQKEIPNFNYFLKNVQLKPNFLKRTDTGIAKMQTKPL